MARLAGIELQDNWRIVYALTKIKGIGWSLSEKALKSAKIDPDKKVGELGKKEIASLTTAIEKFITEGELFRQVRGNITRLKNINSYKGGRHTKGLPVRGQRTRHNARQKRGKRKTVGAFKKEALTKMQQSQKQKENEK